jgi:hypothetical protein
MDRLAGLPWPEPPRIAHRAHLQVVMHLTSVWEGVLRRRACQIRWLGRGMEGATRGDAREFIHGDTQPGRLQPQNGTNHQLIKHLMISTVSK